MESVRWNTEEAHSDNSATMCDYLEYHNMLDITIVDGTYAEGVNGKGEMYEIHAGGDGDSFNHIVTFKRIND